MEISGQNHLKASIVTFVCVIQVIGAAILSINASTMYPLASRAVSLTCSIPSFTAGAGWTKSGVSLTQCLSSVCFPPFSVHYQFSANANSITVTIRSLDIAQDEATWSCVHNAGADIGVYNLIVFKIPSALSINGPTSSAVSDSVTVHLSVNTNCIHPIDTADYNITWKYVEAGSTAEKLFDTGITQNFTSVGGCVNAYEDNLMLNLYLTNKMNTGTTTLYITQVKMTFIMAGQNVLATLNVTYNVTGTGTSSTTSSASNQLALGRGLGLNFGLGFSCFIIAFSVSLA